MTAYAHAPGPYELTLTPPAGFDPPEPVRIDVREGMDPVVVPLFRDDR